MLASTRPDVNDIDEVRLFRCVPADGELLLLVGWSPADEWFSSDGSAFAVVFIRKSLNFRSDVDCFGCRRSSPAISMAASDGDDDVGSTSDDGNDDIVELNGMP